MLDIGVQTFGTSNTQLNGLRIFRRGGCQAICQERRLDHVTKSWARREILMIEVHATEAPIHCPRTHAGVHSDTRMGAQSVESPRTYVLGYDGWRRSCVPGI